MAVEPLRRLHAELLRSAEQQEVRSSALCSPRTRPCRRFCCRGVVPLDPPWLVCTMQEFAKILASGALEPGIVDYDSSALSARQTGLLSALRGADKQQQASSKSASGGGRTQDKSQRQARGRGSGGAGDGGARVGATVDASWAAADKAAAVEQVKTKAKAAFLKLRKEVQTSRSELDGAREALAAARCATAEGQAAAQQQREQHQRALGQLRSQLAAAAAAAAEAEAQNSGAQRLAEARAQDAEEELAAARSKLAEQAALWDRRLVEHQSQCHGLEQQLARELEARQQEHERDERSAQVRVEELAAKAAVASRRHTQELAEAQRRHADMSERASEEQARRLEEARRGCAEEVVHTQSELANASTLVSQLRSELEEASAARLIAEEKWRSNERAEEDSEQLQSELAARQKKIKALQREVRRMAAEIERRRSSFGTPSGGVSDGTSPPASNDDRSAPPTPPPSLIPAAARGPPLPPPAQTPPPCPSPLPPAVGAEDTPLKTGGPSPMGLDLQKALADNERIRDAQVGPPAKKLCHALSDLVSVGDLTVCCACVSGGRLKSCKLL